MNTVYSRYALDRFTPEGMAALVERCHVLVAESSFGLVGYAVVSESGAARWEIETVYILPRFQNSGLGRRLIDTIASSFRGLLWLKCGDDNLQALAFYRKYGLAETGVTWFELDGERYRCLVFELCTT
jgi:ribosomal protein S18 acetylase RimI-like enzyme